MRAIVCSEWGGPEKLTVNDVPPPPLRDGAVRIRVHAAGVNFADLLLIAGQYQESRRFLSFQEPKLPARLLNSEPVSMALKLGIG